MLCVTLMTTLPSVCPDSTGPQRCGRLVEGICLQNLQVRLARGDQLGPRHQAGRGGDEEASAERFDAGIDDRDDSCRVNDQARSSKHYVRVRTNRVDELISLLGAAHAVERDPDGALHVSGLSAAAMGDLAASRGIALHELTEIASFEDAFIELTHDHVDFAAAPVLPAQANGVTHPEKVS